MRSVLNLCLAITLILASATAFAGNAYYIDPSASSDGNGSYSKPWKYISSVNDHSFSTGDDIYFKVNTRCSADSYLEIDWDGTASDKVIVGAYYGENRFGLNGNDRPIIDGKSNTIPSRSVYVGLVTKRWGSGNVIIQDLRVEYAGKYGFALQDTKNVTIKNCQTYRSWSNGIIVARVIDATIDGNVVEESRFSGQGAGASLEVTGNDLADSCYNIEIKNNIVFHGFEGIGIYKKARDVNVTSNIVYDCGSYQIYVGPSKNITVSGNISYSSSEAGKWGGPSVGISINNEKARGYCYTGSVKIEGNLVAGCYHGINIGLEYMQVDSDCSWNNVYIKDNIVVDSKAFNFRFWDSTNKWDVNLTDNISCVYSTSARHCSNYSQPGFSWLNNSFNSNVSGDAAKTALNNAVELKKQTGWQSLSPGNVNSSYFATEGGGSSSTVASPDTPINLKILPD